MCPVRCVLCDASCAMRLVRCVLCNASCVLCDVSCASYALVLPYTVPVLARTMHTLCPHLHALFTGHAVALADYTAQGD
jgi:hypothetical protein